MITPGSAPQFSQPSYVQTGAGPIPSAIYNPINEAWTQHVNEVNRQAEQFNANPQVQAAQQKQQQFASSIGSLPEKFNDFATQKMADTQARVAKAGDLARGFVSNKLKQQNPTIYSQGF